MRVLQLIDSLNAGGAERVAVNYANALSTRVEGAYLCTTRKEGALKEFIYSEVSYLYLNRTKTLDIRATLKLKRYIQENKIQIVHAHGSSYFIAVLVKIIFPKFILVWHCHDGKTQQFGRFKKNTLRYLSRWFDTIFTVSELLLKWCEDYLKGRRAYYIKNFVVDTKPKSKPPHLFPGVDGKRLVCVANLRPDKNHGLLLDAFSMILKKEPEATLHLFGTDFKDEYSKIILGIIEVQFRESVFYHGMYPDILAILPAFDVGVLSSDAEGLPLALLEYGQVGFPTVVTDVGQCKEVVNGHAEVLSKGDGKAIARSVLKILKNPLSAKEQGRKLQAHFKAAFGESTILNQVMSIYEEELKNI